MPFGTSDHLFSLVKSLSASEWFTYRRLQASNIYNPHSTDENGDLAHQVVVALSKMETYDDQKLRDQFIKKGNQKEVQSYKDAKRLAEDRVLESIVAAPENQSLQYQLEKLPNLIQHLEHRKVDFRIKKLLSKFLPAASRSEAFDVQLALLQHQSNLFERTLPAKEKQVAIEKVYQQFEEIRKKQEEIHSLQSEKQSIKLLFQSPLGNQDQFINKRSEAFYSKGYPKSSSKSTMLWLEIHQRLRLFHKDTLGYREALAEMVKTYESNPSPLRQIQFFKIYVFALSSNISLLARSGEIEKSEIAYEALKTLSEREKSTSHKRIFQEAVILQQLPMGRTTLDAAQIMAGCEAGMEFYGDNPFLLRGKKFIQFARLASESLSALGDFSKAAFWIQKIIGSKPSPVLPEITLASNLWALFLWYELEEMELLESGERKSRRYIKKYASKRIVPRILQDLAKDLITNPTPKFQYYLEQIDSIQKDDPSLKILNYYPFLQWLKHKVKGTSFVYEIEKSNHFRPSL